MSFYDRMVVIDSAINGAVERAIRAMTRAEAEIEPALPNHTLRVPEQRMRFFARHLRDMQSLRWLPLQICLIGFPTVLSWHLTWLTTVWLGVVAAALTAGWFYAFKRYSNCTFGETRIAHMQLWKFAISPSWLVMQQSVRSRQTRPFYIAFFILACCQWSIANSASTWGWPHAEMSQFWPLAGKIIVIVFYNQAVYIFTFGSLFWAAMDDTNVKERRWVKAASAFAIFILFGSTVVGWVSYGGVREFGALLLLNAMYDFVLMVRSKRLAVREAAHV